MRFQKRNWDDPRDIAFRKEVRKRDKNCQMPGCGSYVKLQVHHVIRWATNYLLRYNVKNGILLCRKCHDKIKNKEGYYAQLFIDIIKRKYL